MERQHEVQGSYFSKSMHEKSLIRNRGTKPSGALSFPARILQRKCACGGSLTTDGRCEECKQKLQRKENGPAPATVPPVVHEVLHSSGRPLDKATRSFFEPRFGHDFSKVRVHADQKAAESARMINAEAYTVGRHVVFGGGQYLPDSHVGRELIAHELTHVLQQGTHEGSCHNLSLGQPGDSYEQEADRWSSSVIGAQSHSQAGRRSTTLAPHSSGSGLIQRKIPTGISLKETHALGHANLKTEEDKKKYLTYIADVSLMQLTPAGDYTDGQQKGECTKEFLTEVSNTCPGSQTFCEGDKCFQVNQYKRPVGDGHTGVTVPDGPDTFVDFHRARFGTSLLEGSGKKQCSVVCHQLYKYRSADGAYHELGAFYIIRNFKADKFTPSGSTTAINITTGEIRKVAAGSSAPSKADFAAKIAPGLAKSGALLDAPSVSTPTQAPAKGGPTKGEEKK